MGGYALIYGGLKEWVKWYCFKKGEIRIKGVNHIGTRIL